MTYVDLNPIRAGMVETPEESDYTSIQQRIQIDTEDHKKPSIQLIAFDPTNVDHHLPMDLHDYLELVDWTGRAIVPNKKGSIPEHLPKILNRLGIEKESWLGTMTNIQHRVSTRDWTYGSYSIPYVTDYNRSGCVEIPLIDCCIRPDYCKFIHKYQLSGKDIHLCWTGVFIDKTTVLKY